jgi:hypothetical protein
MEYEIELYERTDDKVPVLDFIVSLNPKQQAKIYREIELLTKFGNELHFPHVRKIEGEKYNSLWELRIDFASDAFRIFYFMYIEIKVFYYTVFKKRR